MLVPTIRSGTTPRLSSRRSTGMCAMPLAPPPESTSAVLPPSHAGTDCAWTGPARSASASAPIPLCLPRAILISMPTRAPTPAWRRPGFMTYVITEACIGVKDRACVDVCPVDCIYEGEDKLYIHPDECIAVGAVYPQCRVIDIYA